MKGFADSAAMAKSMPIGLADHNGIAPDLVPSDRRFGDATGVLHLILGPVAEELPRVQSVFNPI